MKHERNTNKVWLFCGCALFALLFPSVAHAEDVVRALEYAFGLAVVFSLLLGLAVAAALRFVFKRGNLVWLIVPVPPVLLVFYLMVFSPFPPPSKILHCGPYIENVGGGTVTVSFGFGRADLDRLWGKIESPQFRSELAKYTNEPISNYVFAVWLETPGKFKNEPEGRHYVGLQVRPAIDMLKARSMSDAVTYVFSKFVLETDPQPSDTLYKEPARVPLVQKAN